MKELFWCDATWSKGIAVIGYTNTMATITKVKTVNAKDNNIAEIMAINLAIEEQGNEITILTDSSLAVTCFKNHVVCVTHIPRDKNIANTLVRAAKENSHRRHHE